RVALVLRRVAVLVAGEFFVLADFFAGAVLGVRPLADFFAVVDFADDFLGLLRLCPVVLLASLLAAPAAARPPARPFVGSWLGSATTDLKYVPGRNRGELVLAIGTRSPVRGLRPVRGARSARSKVPKPVIPTVPPAATSRI